MAIRALVMVSHDLRDLGVVIYVSEDPLSNGGVFLHLTPLVESERSRLLEKTRSESNLPDVVYEAAKMNETLLALRQTHAGGDISRVHGNGS
jgi:hypothetical protein